MATFRGSGSVANGAAFPTEAELQAAIDEANAAASAAAASQAEAAVNVVEAEAAEDGAEIAQGLAEQAVLDAQAEVVLAEAQVALATTQAGLADDARIAAEGEVVLAEAQVALAEAQAVLADTARIAAELAETGATTQAAAASAFATTALGHANDSDTARIASELAYDEFDDRYLGDKASDPTLDNDGNALLTGAMYWNTVTEKMMVYDGAVWVALTGALTETEADLLYQPLDEELSDIAALAPTKGRIIVGNGSAWTDFGVGTNDQVITADSAEAKGVKWATPYAGPSVFHGSQADWADNTVYSFAHGLGGTPDIVLGFYECAITDGVWEPGDKVPFTWQYIYSIGTYGGLSWSDETHVGVISQTNGYYIPAKSGTGTVSITKANWKITATAIKF